MEILKDENNQNYIKDTNPYEKFERIAKFGLKYQIEVKCESIADHSFSVALLALTIIEKNKLNLDTFKCIKMGIIHELGEVYAGDFTPYDNITKKEKHIKEKEAILRVLETLNENNDFLELWEEFEKAETDEAKFIKNVDKLEFLLQACAYGYDAQYFEKSLSIINDPCCKEIALSAVETTHGNKKPKVIG